MTEQIDWDRLASRFNRIQADMVHVEHWTGPGMDAEALRRLFGYRAADDPGADGHGRPLSYEHLTAGQGLTTVAAADYLRDSHTIIDRMNLERAEAQVAEMRAEVRRVYREAAADLAKLIRDRCNERTVPSRYRREGVEWAADLIDPTVPKDRYGNVVAPAETEAA